LLFVEEERGVNGGTQRLAHLFRIEPVRSDVNPVRVEGDDDGAFLSRLAAMARAIMRSGRAWTPVWASIGGSAITTPAARAVLTISAMSAGRMNFWSIMSHCPGLSRRSESRYI
jgi:hypothetical protein